MAELSKKVEENIIKLIELNDELENYFRNTIIPQLFVDANYILRKFTPPAMKQFNFKDSDIGRKIGDLENNIRFPTLVQDIMEVIDSNTVFEKEIQTTDSRWYQMNILPYIVKEDQRPNGVIITFIDITNRIRTLEEVEKLNADHETFIYSVSHDLRAPLANVSGLINEWKEIKDKNSKESDSIVEMISSSAENVKKIIDELGDVSKGRHDLKKEGEIVRFENVLADAKLTLKQNILRSNASIKTEFNESEINISRKNIRSILYNLLSNAIKYKAPERDPEIFIKTEKSDDYILLSVKDNGLGIEDDKRSLIFSNYTRLNNKVEGTGVGLFVVSRMVENNGGKIEIESSLGKGSTFKVYFPIP